MIFIDSNIWCYYLDQRLKEHQNVKQTMREIIRKNEIAINTIIVMEVAHYIVRHFTPENAKKRIDLFINLKNLNIRDFNHQEMTQALDILVEHAYSSGIGGRDATIIATMKNQNITRLATHDKTLKQTARKLQFEVTDLARTTNTTTQENQ